MTCKICGGPYGEMYEIHFVPQAQTKSEVMRYPVCSLLCAGLYRRWLIGKQRGRRANCKRGKKAV